MAEDSPYRIGNVVDELAKRVRQERDPLKRLEELLGLITKVSLEIDHLHWQNEKRKADLAALEGRIDEANEEIRKLRGRLSGDTAGDS